MLSGFLNLGGTDNNQRTIELVNAILAQYAYYQVLKAKSISPHSTYFTTALFRNSHFPAYKKLKKNQILVSSVSVPLVFGDF